MRSIEAIALRVTLLVVGIGLVLVVGWQLRGLILLVLLAVVLAAAMSVPVDALTSRGVPRVVAVVGSFLTVLAAIVVVIALLVPPLVNQVGELVANAPSLVAEARERIEAALGSILPGRTDPSLDGLGAEMQRQLLGALPSAAALLEVPIALVAGIANVVIVLFLSGLLVLEAPRAAPLIRRIAGPGRAEPTLRLVDAMRGKLARFIGAQLLVMTIVGAGTGLGMFLLGVPYVVPLAVLAFLTEAIPLVGPYIAGVPIIAVALLDSPTTGLAMAVWIVIVQQLEGSVILPTVAGNTLRLSPVVVMLAVLAGASLAGVLGALLAVPLVALGQVVLESVVLPVLDRRHGAA